jgi:hypothetical protein
MGGGVMVESDADRDSYEATIELLSDPVAMAEIEESRRAIAVGDVTTIEDMRELMAERLRRASQGQTLPNDDDPDHR